MHPDSDLSKKVVLGVERRDPRIDNPGSLNLLNKLPHKPSMLELHFQALRREREREREREGEGGTTDLVEYLSRRVWLARLSGIVCIKMVIYLRSSFRCELSQFVLIFPAEWSYM